MREHVTTYADDIWASDLVYDSEIAAWLRVMNLDYGEDLVIVSLGDEEGQIVSEHCYDRRDRIEVVRVPFRRRA